MGASRKIPAPFVVGTLLVFGLISRLFPEFAGFPGNGRTELRARDIQRPAPLAADVRYFAKTLPRMLTRKEHLAEQFFEFHRAKRPEPTAGTEKSLDRTL